MKVLLIKCDLAFRENSILTKEMLSQMNNEPKWLIFDEVSNIKCGIISGFEFANEGMDYHSVITKGNIIIDGKWYRLSEDYMLKGDKLEGGQQYDIVLVPDNDSFVVDIVKRGISTQGLKLAGFKYEFSEHKRVFRIPEELTDFRRGEAYLKEINVPHYNFNGVCICPRHITNCVKESLAQIQNKTIKQEIIYQTILNSGTVSVESLCDLVGTKKEETISLSLIEKLIKSIGNQKIYVEESKIEVAEEDTIKNVSKSSSSGKRSRRMGQRGEST